MKKISLSIAALLLLCLISCTEEANPLKAPADQTKERLYLFNGIGDLGTLSVIQEGTITNNIATLGKYPNDIRYNTGYLYVLNSGDKGAGNIQIIDEITSKPAASLEMAKEGASPWQMAFANGKLYVTSLYSPGIEVFSLSERKYLKTIAIPGLTAGVGTTAICAVGDRLFVNKADYSYDENWNAEYKVEKIFVLDSKGDSILTSFSSGLSVADMLLDKEDELHILCSGDRKNIGGYVKIFDLNSYQLKDSLFLGSEPAKFRMTEDGDVFVALSCWSATSPFKGGLLKYNSSTNTVTNSSTTPLYTSKTSGIMDVHIAGDKSIYLPLFNDNKLAVINSSGTLIKEYITGNGPQGLCFVKTGGK